MTNYHWTGATSNLSTTADNWNPVAVPGAGDVVIFDNQGTQNCRWVHTATGSSITVDEIIIESNFSYNLELNAVPTIKGMFLNKNITHGTVGQIEFRNGPISSGGYKTYNEKYILIGDSANYPNGRQNLTFDFYALNVCKFDDGQHPIVRLVNGTFHPDYTTPTGTSGLTDFHELSIASTVTTFARTGSITADDKLKHFKMSSGATTQFVCNIPLTDWGASTVEFTGVSSGTFNLPVSKTTSYNSGNFEAYYTKIILSANTASDRIDMEDNRYVSLVEFEIGDGLLFVGPRTLNAQGSDIRTILPPKIRGSWSFSSISDGIYRSPTHASGPMPKVQGNFHITGKLDVDGLIDPTGLELTPQGSNPGGVAANTLWLNSGDSNKLYQGSSAVGGSGGGSGTVTSVAVTGSDGIEVDSGSPITTSGTIALGVNKTNMLSHLNVDDGADVTDTANVTAAGALMDSEVTNLADVKAFDPADYATATQGTTADNALPKAGGTMTGEIEGTTITLNAIPADPATDAKVRLGESGTSSNMLRIQTNDGRIDIGPNNGSYAHIQTDRAQFYFQQPILVDGGGKVFAYNDGLKLGTGTSASGGTTAITIADGSADITVAGTTTSTGFIKSGGTSSEFLMADGSVSTGGGGGSYSDAQAIAAVEGEATLALTGDVTIASGKGLTVDTNTLKVDATNNRVGIGQASPTTTLHVESSGTAIGLIKSSGGHANVRIDRASNQSDAALLFYTGGSLGWRIQESGSAGNPGNDLYIIDQDGSPDTARMRFHDAGTVEVSQAFQQGTVASAVLVADANGVLTAASALQDLAYLQGGQAEQDAFTPTGTSGPFWGGSGPPNTIQEAIERIASYVAQEISAITGGPPVIP